MTHFKVGLTIFVTININNTTKCF